MSRFCYGPSCDLLQVPILCPYTQSRTCLTNPIDSPLQRHYCSPFCLSIACFQLVSVDSQNVTDAVPCKLCAASSLDPLHGEFRGLRHTNSSKQGLVKKESCLCILDYPCKAFFQIYAGNGTASDDVPFVRSNSIQLQPLHRSNISVFRLDDITERLESRPLVFQMRPCSH